MLGSLSVMYIYGHSTATCQQWKSGTESHVATAPALSNFTSTSFPTDCYIILPLSLKTSTSRIRASQTCLTLTNFIEKNINIYDIK